MAPLPPYPTETMGVLLPRYSRCQSRYGCGSIPAEKRPIIIVVGVIVAIIVITVFLCSCGCCGKGRGAGTSNRNTPTNGPNGQNTAAGNGATAGQGGGAGTGAGAGAGAGADRGVEDQPPPMYEETGAPPPTYQRDAGNGTGGEQTTVLPPISVPPERRGEMAPRYA